MVKFYGRKLDLNYSPAKFFQQSEKQSVWDSNSRRKRFWKMLFGLNTVSVLTLIDVPVCFPLLLQTEITHRSGYYRLGGVKQKLPFLQLFVHPFVTLPFPLFRVQRKQWQKIEVNRRKQNDKKRVTGEWENMQRITAEKREDLYKGRSYNQFNHPNWKYTCPQAATWFVTILYWNVYQDVKRLTLHGQTLIYLSVLSVRMIPACSFK